jgi:hypothetical protein
MIYIVQCHNKLQEIENHLHENVIPKYTYYNGVWDLGMGRKRAVKRSVHGGSHN